MKKKKIRMDYSMTLEECFEQFLTAKRAKGVVEKTIQSYKYNFINGKITCTVDKETQRITDITFSNTDILDLGVKVAFSNLNAKMNLVCEDNYKITY